MKALKRYYPGFDIEDKVSVIQFTVLPSISDTNKRPNNV